MSNLIFQVWLSSYPSLFPHHSKNETNPEVAVPFQTVHEAFPLRVTTDGGIRLRRWQPALRAQDLKAVGLGVGHTETQTDTLTTGHLVSYQMTLL